MEQAIDRLLRTQSPYPSPELDGMIADFKELESYGVDIVRVRKTGDARELLNVAVKGREGLAAVLETRWKESLRLSHESYHTIDEGPPVALRFATLGGVGYITGRITAEGQA